MAAAPAVRVDARGFDAKMLKPVVGRSLLESLTSYTEGNPLNNAGMKYCVEVEPLWGDEPTVAHPRATVSSVLPLNRPPLSR